MHFIGTTKNKGFEMLNSKLETAEILGVVTDISKCSDLRGLYFSRTTIHLQEFSTYNSESQLQGLVFFSCKIPEYLKLNASCTLIDCSRYKGFENVEVVGRRFKSQSFSSLDLSESVLEDCHFIYCEITDTDFRGASLKNTKFAHTTFKDTDFRDVKLKRLFLANVELNNVDFSGQTFEALDPQSSVSYMYGCDFSRTKISNAKCLFENVLKLRNIKFSYADFSGLDDFFRSRTIVFCKFDNADVSNNTIRYADMSISDCTKSRFVACEIDGSDFSECIFEEADFSGVQMRFTKLKYCSLKMCILSSARLERVTLIGSSLSEATCYNTILLESKFVISDFKSTKLEICAIKDCEFKECSFENAEISVVQFINCKFTNCKFEGASFKDVAMINSVYDEHTTGIALDLMQSMVKI